MLLISKLMALNYCFICEKMCLKDAMHAVKRNQRGNLSLSRSSGENRDQMKNELARDLS